MTTTTYELTPEQLEKLRNSADRSFKIGAAIIFSLSLFGIGYTTIESFMKIECNPRGHHFRHQLAVLEIPSALTYCAIYTLLAILAMAAFRFKRSGVGLGCSVVSAVVAIIMLIDAMGSDWCGFMDGF